MACSVIVSEFVLMVVVVLLNIVYFQSLEVGLCIISC